MKDLSEVEQDAIEREAVDEADGKVRGQKKRRDVADDYHKRLRAGFRLLRGNPDWSE